MRSLLSHISVSLEERAREVANDITMYNKEYSELCDRILEVENQILEYLPHDYKTLFYDLEILCCERNYIKNIIVYKQGVKDGLRIKNLLRESTKVDF